jgi:hypothetical protein
MPVYTLDIYQGWTRERLKDRCLELCRAVDDWQQIAMALAEHGKEGLSPSDLERVEGLIEAYRD